MQNHRGRRTADEPTPAELAAIEREWPLIAAELAVVDAEVVLADAEGEASELDARRLANAQATVDALSRTRPVRRSRHNRRTA
jgi:hypothetical protein